MSSSHQLYFTASFGAHGPLKTPKATKPIWAKLLGCIKAARPNRASAIPTRCKWLGGLWWVHAETGNGESYFDDGRL